MEDQSSENVDLFKSLSDWSIHNDIVVVIFQRH